MRAVTGSTLLPFRLIPVVTLALALAGVIGSLALARWAVTTSPAHSRGRVAAVAVVVAGLAAIQMVQHVSEEDSHFAAAARANAGVPEDVLGAIDDMTGDRAPSDLRARIADTCRTITVTTTSTSTTTGADGSTVRVTRSTTTRRTLPPA